MAITAKREGRENEKPVGAVVWKSRLTRKF
jgi:hypothetical protein